MKEFLLDLFFPPKCACCGRVLNDPKEDPCPACVKKLPFLREDAVLHTGPYGLCAITFCFEGPIRQAVYALKFSGRRSAAKALAPFLVQTVAERLSGAFDTVTYVPVSPQRLRERGYDQARLLAEAMAGQWQTAVVPALCKIRHTKAQSSLSTRALRQANVAGAYQGLPAARGRRLLLVDDILTTGSTMTAAAEALRAAGAASVVCAALASPAGPGEIENKP